MKRPRTKSRLGKKPQDVPAASLPMTARASVVRALQGITFFKPAIRTAVIIEPDGLHIQIDSFERETGDPSIIDIRKELPLHLPSREHAVAWIYSCVRDAWVHELNEALFVDGVRRNNLHDERGSPLPPPDETPRPR